MITVLSNITSHIQKEWNDFLAKHPNNTVFQSPEVFEFYQKVKNFFPYVFISQDKNGEINGVLLAVLIKEGKGLKGYFSSRAVIYGGPLIKESDKQEKLVILDRLLNAIVNKLKNKTIFIQFRNFFEWTQEEKQIFEKYGFTFKDRLNLLVDTSSEQVFWLNVSESRKRQLKKGIRNEEIKTVEPQDEEEVEIFYQLLSKLYKTKVKKPLPDFSFFKNFYNFSKQGKLGIIRLIKVNDEIIGGILSPVTNGKNIYEWYITGLDQDFKKSYPSIMATWSSIDFALKNNLNHFDFMGLGTPDTAYGVRDFKMRFGGKMVNYGRFARRNNKRLYSFAEFGYNLFRSLKWI